MPRLTEKRRLAREESLIAAAQSEFVMHGFQDASISGIARRAGVSDGLLYRYFADKREMMTAVLERFFASIIATAEARVELERGFAARLVCLIREQLNIFAQQPELCRLFIRHLREHEGYVGSALQARARQYTDLVVRIASEARISGEVHGDLDPRELRDLVFGGIEHLAWRTIMQGRPFQVDETAERLARMILQGVQKEPEA